jgi:sortase (surface protein transpeptidase)
MALFSLACGGGAKEPVVAASAQPAASPTVTFPAANRIRIPAIGVDAPLNLAAVVGGRLPNTQGTDDVVAYDFGSDSAFGGQPGIGNLIVHARNDAGSIPCHNGALPPPCTATFWSLSALAPGDQVEVFWERSRHSYVVSEVCNVENARFGEAPVTRTDQPTITLLTAGGQFDQARGSYSHQVIVVGHLAGNAARTCPEGTTPGPPDNRRAIRFERRLAAGEAGNPFADAVAYEFKLVGVGSGPIGMPGSGPVRTIPPLPGNAEGIIRNFQRSGETLLVPVPTSVPGGRYLLTVTVGPLVAIGFDHRP